MLRHLVVLVALCAAITLAYPAVNNNVDGIVYNEKGEAFYLIATEECRTARKRRESEHNIKHKTYGYKNEKDGDTIGLKGIYTHKPSQTQVEVDALKKQRGDSRAQVSGKTQYENDDGNSRLSVGANVNKQWNRQGESHTGYGWEVEGDIDF